MKQGTGQCCHLMEQLIRAKQKTADTPLWLCCLLMAVPSFSRIMHPATLQKLFRNDLRNMIRSSRCCLGLPISQISIQLSIYGMCWMKNLINGGLAESIQSNPSLQLAGFKGSAANVLVPETTGHIQRSSEVHALMCESCFGSIRGTYTTLGRWFYVVQHTTYNN